MNELKADVTLDAKGLLCPMPVVKTKLTLEDMDSGQTIKVLATDPGSKADYPAWCSETGNKLLHASEDGGVYTYWIEKV